MSPALRAEVRRVLQVDLRKLRARMEGVGREDGRLKPDVLRLLVTLERAAHYTRESLAALDSPRARGQQCATAESV